MRTVVIGALIGTIRADYISQRVYGSGGCGYPSDVLEYINVDPGCQQYNDDDNGLVTSYQIQCDSTSSGKIVRYLNDDCTGDVLSDDAYDFDDDLDSFFGCLQESYGGLSFNIASNCTAGEYTPPTLSDYFSFMQFGGDDGPVGNCRNQTAGGLKVAAYLPVGTCLNTNEGVFGEFLCSSSDFTITNNIYLTADCSGEPFESFTEPFYTCASSPQNVTKSECVTSIEVKTKSSAGKMISEKVHLEDGAKRKMDTDIRKAAQGASAKSLAALKASLRI